MMSSMVLVAFCSYFDALFVIPILGESAGGADTIKWWIDLALHADKHLEELAVTYGVWTHLILFAIVFCETGLVFTPFLPGDSLLFIAGALAAVGLLKISWLLPLLIAAAIVGDAVNYHMGKWLGVRAMNGKIPLLKKEHLENAHQYFEKYGWRTIIIARFVPIVRTFVPFVAGMGAMSYGRFFLYNVIGGLFWVTAILMLGYAFGSYTFVKSNFTLFALAIIGISVLPMVWEFVAHYSRNKRLNGESSKDQ